MILWRKCTALTVFALACATSRSSAVEPSASELQAARQWVESRWDARTPDRLPFSFVYDGVLSTRLLPSWHVRQQERNLDQQRSQRTIALSEPRTGLRLRCVATIYHDFPAVEWVLYFKNLGNADTPILEGVRALSTRVEATPGQRLFTLYHAKGSHEEITDFQPLKSTIGPGQNVRLASFGGRSSDGDLPFWNLADPAGGGIAAGIGWTGQWTASFRRGKTSGRDQSPLHIQAGMETTHLRLHPGEEIRSPAILMLFWQGADRRRGQNLFRQLLLRHCTPTVGRELADPPCAASPHAVVPFEKTTEKNMLEAIGNIAAHHIPFDTWWIDAGWYRCPGGPSGWARAVGNFGTDPGRFPNGLKPVADAAHKAGMRFLLWFEPERVMPGSEIFQAHPEWLMKPGGDIPAALRYQLNDGFHLLNLGNPQALAWLKCKVSGMIGRIGIDCYRNDFNLYPLYFWRNGEAADRQGMNEIKYVTGLYDYFDTLKREHPRLLLDTCASGGRRIDFEMLRRALVLTRSDYLWDPIGQQCHTYGLAQWIPITGIGSASLDPYNCRSGLGSHFALAADFYSTDDKTWDGMVRAVKEFKRAMPLYCGDYYPLSLYSAKNDTWMAWQFHRCDLDEGVVQAFRRKFSPQATVAYLLHGLDPAAEYAVVNWDEPGSRRVTGRELMGQGIVFQIRSRPGAAVCTYRRVGREGIPQR